MDTYEPLFTPVVYKALGLIHESTEASNKALNEFVNASLNSRNNTESFHEEVRPSTTKTTIPEKSVKTEKLEPQSFDDVPTSSISIERKSSSNINVSAFSDGNCSKCQYVYLFQSSQETKYFISNFLIGEIEVILPQTGCLSALNVTEVTTR